MSVPVLVRDDGPLPVLLYCFRHELRAAIAYREAHPGVTIVDATHLDLEADYMEAERVLAGAYCWGRVQKLYGEQEVEEVWLPPEYRHKVKEVEGGFALFEEVAKEWLQVGRVQPTEADAWAILDDREFEL